MLGIGGQSVARTTNQATLAAIRVIVYRKTIMSTSCLLKHAPSIVRWRICRLRILVLILDYALREVELVTDLENVNDVLASDTLCNAVERLVGPLETFGHLEQNAGNLQVVVNRTVGSYWPENLTVLR